jgi:hypothetical protein
MRGLSKQIHQNGNRHPYMNPQKWLDGTLCFWLQPHPGQLFSYKVESYQPIIDNAEKQKGWSGLAPFRR